MTTHVYPIDDWIEHDTESLNCPCEPLIEFDIDKETLVIHNSVSGEHE